MSDEKEHRHFICSNLECRYLFCSDEPEYAEMKDGDNCPACLIATVKQAAIAEPPSLDQMMNEAPPGVKEAIEYFRGFAKRQDEQAERALRLREQTRDALRSIANSLELLTGVIAGDDQGRAAVRVLGEFVGGDGDVREPA